VSQVHGPGEAIGQFLGEVGGVGAGLQGSALDSAEALHEFLTAGSIIGTAGIAQDLAARSSTQTWTACWE
jgi:hypothetical protein